DRRNGRGALVVRDHDGGAVGADFAARIGAGGDDQVDAAIAIALALGAEAQRARGIALCVGREVAGAGVLLIVFIAVDEDAEVRAGVAGVLLADAEAHIDEVVIGRPEHALGDGGGHLGRGRVLHGHGGRAGVGVLAVGDGHGHAVGAKRVGVGEG